MPAVDVAAVLGVVDALVREPALHQVTEAVNGHGGGEGDDGDLAAHGDLNLNAYRPRIAPLSRPADVHRALRHSPPSSALPLDPLRGVHRWLLSTMVATRRSPIWWRSSSSGFHKPSRPDTPRIGSTKRARVPEHQVHHTRAALSPPVPRAAVILGRVGADHLDHTQDRGRVQRTSPRSPEPQLGGRTHRLDDDRVGQRCLVERGRGMDRDRTRVLPQLRPVLRRLPLEHDRRRPRLSDGQDPHDDAPSPISAVIHSSHSPDGLQAGPMMAAAVRTAFS